MTGLRNNITMLRYTALFCLLIDFSACRSQNGTKIAQQSEHQGYLNSAVYKDVLEKYGDKKDVLRRDRELFSLIGEDAILDNSDYDFYALSIYKEKGESLLKVYVVRSKQNVSSAAYKEATPDSYSTCDTGKAEGQFYSIKSISRIIQKQDWLPVKSRLEKTAQIVGERLPRAYDAPFHIVIYFNGKKFYRFSTYQVDEQQMQDLNEMFQKSLLFE